jgi:plastocyanin
MAARHWIAAALAAVGAIAAGPASAKDYPVVIKNMRFGPVPSGLRAGDAIVWINADIFRHTATARDKSFDLDLAAGARGRTVLRKGGAIAFYCRFHPGMTGQLKVGR